VKNRKITGWVLILATVVLVGLALLSWDWSTRGRIKAVVAVDARAPTGTSYARRTLEGGPRTVKIREHPYNTRHTRTWRIAAGGLAAMSLGTLAAGAVLLAKKERTRK
jgi:hypothetical protein